MFQRNHLSIFLSGLMLLAATFWGCSKSDSGAPTDQIYKKWVFTHSIGRIFINGDAVASSEMSNSRGDVTVEFQRSGQYQYIYPLLSNEAQGFQKTDSLIHLQSDSSAFANFCAYPVISFIIYPPPPGPPVLKMYKVSPDLHIVFIGRDSLQVRTDLVRPGIGGAPDTLISEYTGFRKG